MFFVGKYKLRDDHAIQVHIFFSLSCRCSLRFLTHSTNDISGAGMRDEPLRMSTWEAIYFLEYFVILLSSCNLLGLIISSFNLLFGCFSYFIQNVLEDYDDIVVTVGSGGTASGMAIIGNYLTGSKLK